MPTGVVLPPRLWRGENTGFNVCSNNNLRGSMWSQRTRNARGNKSSNRNQNSRRTHLRKMASIAACIALLLIGGTMMKNAFYPSSTDPNPELAGSVYGMEECKSLAELTKKAGFNVKDIPEADMPFKVMSTSYLWCWNEFAQIIYEGTDNSLTYRKTRGTDDISGDYNQYEQILDKVVNGVDITIKGNHDKYYLATWHTKDYSYSISLNEGITLETILNIIQNSME